ncbi:hypothetical protein F2Y87_18030 [Bacteroides cellulosilyticus]|uniref:Uncharacterized protein n=1 Tax=Bacteroides cellulosilyticus TaxID=246787 RepID=A0A6L3JZ51_9BACE|nr:hypothetical protein F2Y87_18030 [Bacteroides cellulosilyticus]
MLRTCSVSAPCRGISEWRMYGASTVRIRFRYAKDKNKYQCLLSPYPIVFTLNCGKCCQVISFIL